MSIDELADRLEAVMQRVVKLEELVSELGADHDILDSETSDLESRLTDVELQVMDTE